MAVRWMRASGRVRAGLEALPVFAILLIGGVVLAGVGAGGYYAYQAYDFVEHDNDFCFSCHLMQEPYELFAQSAHRELGCKACHQPNLLERSTMGVTAITVNPDSVSEHAPVPNELCASCHIEGDPEAWTVIAGSAGHRVHLESDDPVLDGLQCVECHASSLHQFAPVQDTCAQSSCHTEPDVRLGAMSDLAIHCTACHAFNSPVPEEQTPTEALAPDFSTCLSCHAMRALVELPDPDPHQADCSACHNPHTQETPAEAGGSCGAAGCHTDPSDLTPFHRGLDEAVVANCGSCHQAHDFGLDGSDCVACHVDIARDEPGAVAPSGAAPPGNGVDLSRLGPASARPGMHLLHAVHPFAPWNAPLPQALEFRHADHPSVSCTDCHDSSEEHGRVEVTTVTDCRACHHGEETVDAMACETCHGSAESSGDPYEVTRALMISARPTDAPAIERALPFDHAVHAGEACATCHTDGLDRSAASVACVSCHAEHHRPTASCMACHVEAAPGSHAVETAHLGCSGSGCHVEVPFEGLPRTRDVCLTCHQDLVDHRPEGDCAECHALPDQGERPG